MNINQQAVQLDGLRGALWLPEGAGVFPADYLRRDATALSLILLSMLDITSSFLKGWRIMGSLTDAESIAYLELDVNRRN